jgi:hypothetical protein
MPICDCSPLIDDHQFASGDSFLLPSIIAGLCDRKIPLISDQQPRKTIDGLRGLERKCFASRSRFAFYDYLAAVFELYARLRRTKQAKKAATLIAKLFGLRNQKRTHPIRVILDATSTTDDKTKSRWSRALRYAWRERRTWTDLRSTPRSPYTVFRFRPAHLDRRLSQSIP